VVSRHRRPDVHAAVVAATAAEGFSVSAWMIAAAWRSLRVRSGLAAVAEWEAENGPVLDRNSTPRGTVPA
jgi:hypothetical protein